MNDLERLVRKHDAVLFGAEEDGGTSLVKRFLRAEKLLWANTILLVFVAAKIGVTSSGELKSILIGGSSLTPNVIELIAHLT